MRKNKRKLYCMYKDMFKPDAPFVIPEELEERVRAYLERGHEEFVQIVKRATIS